MKNALRLLLGLAMLIPLSPIVAEEKTTETPRLATLMSTYGYVEFQRLTVPGGTQLQMSVSHDFNETLGFFAYGEVHRNWGQIYAGPTFSPASWLKVGTGIGLEDIDVSTPLRYGGFLWAGNEKDSLLAVANFGQSGYWWRVDTNHRFSAWFGAGLLAQRDAGIGPRLQLTLPKKPITLWIAPTYFWDTGKPRFVCGLRFQF